MLNKIYKFNEFNVYILCNIKTKFNQIQKACIFMP